MLDCVDSGYLLKGLLASPFSNKAKYIVLYLLLSPKLYIWHQNTSTSTSSTKQCPQIAIFIYYSLINQKNIIKRFIENKTNYYFQTKRFYLLLLQQYTSIIQH